MDPSRYHFSRPGEDNRTAGESGHRTILPRTWSYIDINDAGIDALRRELGQQHVVQSQPGQGHFGPSPHSGVPGTFTSPATKRSDFTVFQQSFHSSPPSQVGSFHGQPQPMAYPVGYLMPPGGNYQLAYLPHNYPFWIPVPQTENCLSPAQQQALQMAHSIAQVGDVQVHQPQPTVNPPSTEGTPMDTNVVGSAHMFLGKEASGAVRRTSTNFRFNPYAAHQPHVSNPVNWQNMGRQNEFNPWEAHKSQEKQGIQQLIGSNPKPFTASPPVGSSISRATLEPTPNSSKTTDINAQRLNWINKYPSSNLPFQGPQPSVASSNALNASASITSDTPYPLGPVNRSPANAANIFSSMATTTASAHEIQPNEAGCIPTTLAASPVSTATPSQRSSNHASTSVMGPSIVAHSPQNNRPCNPWEVNSPSSSVVEISQINISAGPSSETMTETVWAREDNLKRARTGMTDGQKAHRKAVRMAGGSCGQCRKRHRKCDHVLQGHHHNCPAIGWMDNQIQPFSTQASSNAPSLQQPSHWRNTSTLDMIGHRAGSNVSSANGRQQERPRARLGHDTRAIGGLFVTPEPDVTGSIHDNQLSKEIHYSDEFSADDVIQASIGKQCEKNLRPSLNGHTKSSTSTDTGDDNSSAKPGPDSSPARQTVQSIAQAQSSEKISSSNNLQREVALTGHISCSSGEKPHSVHDIKQSDWRTSENELFCSQSEGNFEDETHITAENKTDERRRQVPSTGNTFENIRSVTKTSQTGVGESNPGHAKYSIATTTDVSMLRGHSGSESEPEVQVLDLTSPLELSFVGLETKNNTQGRQTPRAFNYITGENVSAPVFCERENKPEHKLGLYPTDSVITETLTRYIEGNEIDPIDPPIAYPFYGQLS